MTCDWKDGTVRNMQLELGCQDGTIRQLTKDQRATLAELATLRVENATLKRKRVQWIKQNILQRAEIQTSTTLVQALKRTVRADRRKNRDTLDRINGALSRFYRFGNELKDVSRVIPFSTELAREYDAASQELIVSDVAQPRRHAMKHGTAYGSNVRIGVEHNDNEPRAVIELD